MKKSFLAILVALLAFSVDGAAQFNWGVLGGASFSYTPKELLEDGTPKKATLFHAGATLQYKFIRGFSIQPSLLFQMRGAADERVGCLELPVALQWGPDLLLFRPYVEVVPFVGVNVYEKNIDMTAMEYGVGLGGGVEFWRLQLSARYNWNINPNSMANEGAAYGFRCTTLSLAFFF